MARTAPGWITTVSDEDEEEVKWEGLAMLSLRSERALTGADGPVVP